MVDSSQYKAKLLREVQEKGGSNYADTEFVTDLAANSERIGELVARLTDPSASAVDLVGTIVALKAVRNFSKVLPAYSADLTNALRGLIKSPDAEVRRQALSYLSISGDEIAQGHLLDELKSDLPEEQKSVPTHQAISMLSVHDKGIDKGLLMSIAKDPPDEESLLQAVRHLPADEETEVVLTQILQDETQPISVRALIPDMAGTFDPSGFSKIAKKMLEEQGADTEIAPYLARGMANVQSSAGQEDVEGTKRVIWSLADKGSASFKQAAELLHTLEGESESETE